MTSSPIVYLLLLPHWTNQGTQVSTTNANQKDVNIVINTISMKFPYNYYYSYNPIKPIPSFPLVSSSQAIRAMTPSPATGRRLDDGHAEAHRRPHRRAHRRRRPRSSRRSPGDHLVTRGVARSGHESEPPGWFTRSKVNNQKEWEGNVRKGRTPSL